MNNAFAKVDAPLRGPHVCLSIRRSDKVVVRLPSEISQLHPLMPFPRFSSCPRVTRILRCALAIVGLLITDREFVEACLAQAQESEATDRPAIERPAVPRPDTARTLPSPNAALKAALAKIPSPAANDGEGHQRLIEWYAARDFAPAWRAPLAQSLIGYVRDIRRHGLEPFLFDLASVENAWNGSSAATEGDLVAAANRELKTTRLAQRVIHALGSGYVDPSLLQPKWKSLPGRLDDPFALIDRALVLTPGELPAMFDRAAPSDDRYRKMVVTLERYLEIAQRGGWQRLPDPGNTIRLGDPYAGVGLLRARLRAEGDLPAEASRNVPTGIDAETDKAVKAFQFRHGIDPDGVIGPQTLVELNSPVTHRINSLVVNLERMRWMPDIGLGSKQPRIEVNIAESSLRMFRGRRHVETLRVIVGKKGEHQTPMFHDAIQYLIFRPYWNIPVGIARHEIGPVAAEDPDYLARNNYEIVPAFGVAAAAALPINTGTVAAMREGRFSLRQASGPKNALGLVKFIFPNDSAVYLHDTPNRDLFDRTDRDFSHGCVRVSDPARLAEFSLSANGDWPFERIDAALNDAQHPNRQVNLIHPIPVYLIYQTATILDDGRVRFDQDIYEHDRPLRENLGMGAKVRNEPPAKEAEAKAKPAP